jgi:toxin ParE1/3/4
MKGRFRLSHRASRDFVSILETSEERWGADAALRYGELLESAMRTVAIEPNGPTTRDESEIIPGMRSLHVRRARERHGVKDPVHVVYYRLDLEIVEVVGILHERQEPTRHLAEDD